MIARIGGEEFALMMESGPAVSIVAAERLIGSIASRKLSLSAAATGLDEDIDIDVTVSLGLAYARPGMDSTALLAAADRALYAAKRDGRNRLRLAA